MHVTALSSHAEDQNRFSQNTAIFDLIRESNQ